jgi:undecaprenyl-diphosphatase
MDILLIIKALILGIVEGATEFLPISSTGHLIITGDLLNFLAKDKRDVFEIIIQLGAILAVIWEYRVKFIHVTTNLNESKSRQLAINLYLVWCFISKLKSYYLTRSQ